MRCQPNPRQTPAAELLVQIRGVLSTELQQARDFASKEREIQERRIRKLEDDRTKLLDGYYAGAIPIDLMKREQGRLSTELNGAAGRLSALTSEFDVVEANLDLAINLAATWHGAYVRATDVERRLLNQAIFEKLFIAEDGSVVHDFADPFDLLLGHTVVRSVVERIDQTELTPEQSQVIDQAWSALSSRWSADEAARRTRDACRGIVADVAGKERNPSNLVVVGVSNMDLMVGAEGLEPPTNTL